MSRLQSPEARLFLTSAIVLFAELVFIRWVPANVVYVTFFSNLVLMASFLGIGVGILLGRRFEPPRLPFWAPLLVITTLFILAVKIDFRSVRSADDQHAIVRELHRGMELTHVAQ